MLCPDCPTARLARALVFDAAFRDHLAYAVLPFVVAMIAGRGVVAVIERRTRGDKP
jgi:hypothetical protein